MSVIDIVSGREATSWSEMRKTGSVKIVELRKNALAIVPRLAFRSRR
jgi:hypothetical protein